MEYRTLIVSPVNEDSVCGENLEDDSSFQNFFFEAEGTPERFDGQTTVPAEPPEWRTVKKQALTFHEKSRDLKLLSILTQSVLNTEGIVKFEECLQGIADLVSEQWATVFPLLDEDDGDPMERISSLGHLLDKTFVVNILKNTPIIKSKVLGNISATTVDRANDHSITKSDSDLDIAQVKGIFKDSDSEEILAIYTSAQNASTHLRSINQSFITQAGNEYNINFDALTETLDHINEIIERYGKQHLKTLEPQQTDENSNTNLDDAENINKSVNPVPIASTNVDINTMQLNSRAEVEQCLDLICNYYNEFEPSNPIPILINRAKKLVSADFLAILQDIAPEAVDQVRTLGGIKEDIASTTSNEATSSDNDGW